MPISASRTQIATRVQTELVKEAMKLSGRGNVLSKPEQESAKLDYSNLLGRAANDIRREGKLVRLEPLVDKAAAKVIEALDAIDKPGRGHGKISLVEAREAVATKGDAGYRIGKAYELLTGASLEAKGPASAELQKAVADLVKSEKFAILSKANGEPSAWVQDKMEKALEKWGADGLNGTGKVKVGKAMVYVAAGSTYGRDSLKETIGFFDKEGRVLARAEIERDNKSYALTMRVEGDVIATASDTANAPPADWVKALEKELDDKYGNGDDLGQRIGKSRLPAALLPTFEFMERNTPDGVGLEKIEFQGKTAYAIHDYSCVSSVAVYSDEGKKLFEFVS